MTKKETHPHDAQGHLLDGVSTHPMTEQGRQDNETAQHALSQLTVPTLYHHDNPHERLYVALFDGTGNDAVNDPAHMTNVGAFAKQLKWNTKGDPHIWSYYLEGPGTEKNLITNLADGAIGYTYEERIETMYLDFIKQARQWIKDDPKADIRVITTGFSRGAEEAVGLARVIDERGIQDPDGMAAHHRVTDPEFTLPPLVPPGRVMQSVALFDPVGTGAPHHHDRTLPPSVVSGLQIVANDERRNSFPSSQIIPQGPSEDGRFLAVTVPGSHSDIGGSYHLNGLSVLNGNLMTSFINAHSDTPLLAKRLVSQDPALYVVHHSEEHEPFYFTTVYDRDGARDVMGAQLSPPHCRFVELCAPPAPLSPDIAQHMPPRHPVDVGPVPHLPALPVAAQEPERPVLASHTADRMSPRRPLDAARHREVGAIPVAPDFFDRPETTPASSLTAVHRQAGRDIGHDLQLARDVAIINERTRAELGPMPRTPPTPQREHAVIHEVERGARQTTPTHEAVAERPHVPSTPPVATRHPSAVVEATPPARDAAPAPPAPEVAALAMGREQVPATERPAAPSMLERPVSPAAPTQAAAHPMRHAMTDAPQAASEGRSARASEPVPTETTKRPMPLPPRAIMPSHDEREEAHAYVAATDTASPSHEAERFGRHAAPAAPQAEVRPPAHDPRHPSNPHHGLYNELRRCIPDIGENRLMQCTAACHEHRITADNLNLVHLSETNSALCFNGRGPLATPVMVDLNTPSPPAQESMQHIGQTDQFHAQLLAQSQAQSAQQAMQQGPMR